MPRKSFNFRSSLGMGAMGVQMAKSVLRVKYPDIIDYAENREMQKRGIDLYVPGLGYIEVKCDAHKPENFFFELDCDGQPGAVDRSCSDYFCVIFPEHRVIYLIPRPALQKWLRDNITELEDRVRTIDSNERGKHWRASGVIIPIRRLMADIKVLVISWSEEDEQTHAVWGGVVN